MNIRICSGAVGSVVASAISALILLGTATVVSLSSASAEVGTDPTVGPTVITTTTDPSPTPTATATVTTDPSPTSTVTTDPTPTPTPTPTATSEPTPTPEPLVKGFAVQQFTLASGRTYFARVPTCTPAPAPECTDWLGTARQVLIYGHVYGANESSDAATFALNWYANLRKQTDTIWVFAVSAGGTKAFNAGICCTFNTVDDVGYLVDAVADLGTRTTINAGRVGIFGVSNGGMLALRAACERPDVFDAGASFAGTFAGPCPQAGVRIMQMHGAADKVVPLRGGWSFIIDRWINFPPATDLASTMAAGSSFPLTVYPGVGHSPSWTHLYAEQNWVLANLR